MPLASVFGIDVFAHWTVLLVPFVLLVAIAPLIGPDFGALAAVGWTGFWTSVTIAVLATHELGHLLAARRHGRIERSIVLTPLGPVAHGWSGPPGSHGLIAAFAGPAVHGLWTLLGWLVWELIDEAQAGGPESMMFGIFVQSQVALAVVNVLPFYPLDGARALWAVLVRHTTAKRADATIAYLGYGGAVTLGVAGLALILLGKPEHAIWALLLIGAGVSNLIAAQRLLFALQFLSHDTTREQEQWQLPPTPDFLEDWLTEPEESTAIKGNRERTAAAGSDGDSADGDHVSDALVRDAPKKSPKALDPAKRRERLQDRIDELLDRINEVGGLDGLTVEEREELAAASTALRDESSAAAAGRWPLLP